MEGGVLERLVGKAQARAELVGADELLHLVEAQAGVDGELVCDLPFVLHINTREPSELGDIVGDAERIAVIGAVTRNAGLHQRRILDGGLLGADGEAGTQRMRLIEFIGAVTRNAVGVGDAADIRGDAVEQEIADRVWRETQLVVTGEIRQLPVEAVV